MRHTHPHHHTHQPTASALRDAPARRPCRDGSDDASDLPLAAAVRVRRSIATHARRTVVAGLSLVLATGMPVPATAYADDATGTEATTTASDTTDKGTTEEASDATTATGGEASDATDTAEGGAAGTDQDSDDAGDATDGPDGASDATTSISTTNSKAVGRQYFNSKAKTWNADGADDNTDNAESTANGDLPENGPEDSKATTSGEIDVTYTTFGGSWWDPGDDPTVPGADPDEKGTPGDDTDLRHANGTYIVTIPTDLAYTDMRVGTVDTSDTYDVNVRGAIASNMQVRLTVTDATMENTSQGTGDSSSITETTTHEKLTYSPDECYVGINEDGSLIGTTTQDTIELEGTVKSAGLWTGKVLYSASLEEAVTGE